MITETTSSDSVGEDRSGNQRVSRLFFSDQPGVTALDEIRQLVPLGSEHPRIPALAGNPALLADDYVLRVTDNGHTDIEVPYATDRFFPKKEGTKRTVETKIPFVVETLARGIGMAEEDVRPTYKLEGLSIRDTQSAIQRSVTLDNYSEALQELIDAQENKLHLYGTRVRRFEASDVLQYGPREWRVMYSWWNDPGTAKAQAVGIGDGSIAGSTAGEPSIFPNPVEVTASGATVRFHYPKRVANMLGLVSGAPSHGQFVRSPFHEVYVIIHQRATPTFIQYLSFDHDLNGWQTLPGVPPP